MLFWSQTKPEPGSSGALRSVQKAWGFCIWFAIIAFVACTLSAVLNWTNHWNPEKGVWTNLISTNDWGQNLCINLGANFVGAFLVTFAINVIVEKIRYEESNILNQQRKAVYYLRNPATTLKQKKQKVKEMKAKNLFQGADLKGINLDEMDLSGVDFELADLRNASMRGVIAREADFTRAQLSGCKFLPGEKNRSVDLSYAVFVGVSMRSGHLCHANLKGANFTGYAYIAGSKLEGSDLTGATFDDTTIIDDPDDEDNPIKQPSLSLGTTMPDGNRWDGKDETRLAERYRKSF